MYQRSTTGTRVGGPVCARCSGVTTSSMVSCKFVWSSTAVMSSVCPGSSWATADFSAKTLCRARVMGGHQRSGWIVGLMATGV